MKANEVPEKLYVNFHFIETHPWSNQPLVTKQCINKYDIEYIRTDAFIKKALRWMISQGGVNDVLSKEMIDDFRKYIKGD